MHPLGHEGPDCLCVTHTFATVALTELGEVNFGLHADGPHGATRTWADNEIYFM